MDYNGLNTADGGSQEADLLGWMSGMGVDGSAAFCGEAIRFFVESARAMGFLAPQLHFLSAPPHTTEKLK